MPYPIYKGEIPYLTTAQMREVDRAMIEDYHIELMQMMENAGRCLAHLARQRFLDTNPQGKQIVVLAGTGGNGGGGLVCARRLHNYGANVSVCISAEDEEFTPIPKYQLDILRRMNIPIIATDTISSNTKPKLIIDALIGYSLKGAPRGRAKTLIESANSKDAPILALDSPSGIDTTIGTIYEPTIRATATLTLALPKEGLRAAAVMPYLGELYLADISVPPELYKQSFALEVAAIFAESDIIRLS
jgi:NAD(P)H-hydrate epimerase